MTTAVAIRPETQEWIDRHGLTVSQYGTVRLVKVVESDGKSKHGYGSFSGDHGRLAYKPGTTVVCPDYDDTPQCGHGLHFAATAKEAQAIVACQAPRWLVCDVDVESLVVIDAFYGNSNEKVKAAFCHVRFYGDETDFGVFT